MMPLKTNRRVLMWCCAYAADKNTTKWEKILYAISTAFMLSIMLFSAASSALFFWQNMNSDLEQSLMAVMQLLGNVVAAYLFIYGVLVHQEIISIFTQLAEIYEKCAEWSSSRFLQLANEQSERTWSMFFKFLIAGVIGANASLAAISILVSWLIEGNFGTKYLYRPFNLVLPWNQQNLTGYCFEVGYSIIDGTVYFLGCSMIFLFIALCQHHRAFCAIFQHLLNKLNSSRGYEYNKLQICRLVQFHVMIKLFFMQSAVTFSRFILIHLIVAMLMLSISVFHFDLQMQHIDFTITLVMFALLSSVFILFMYCFFGKMATESYEQMANSLYEVDWLGLPIGLQKSLMFIIRNAQQPLYYHGFGLAILNLQTFTRLIRTVYTYYMIFKTITGNL